MKKTFIATGNILHNHKLYQEGDTITFEDGDSAETIEELQKAGNLGGKEGKAIARKRMMMEEQSGLTGMDDDQIARLWRTTTAVSADVLRNREKEEQRVKETAAGQRKANINAGAAPLPTVSGEQREQQALASQREHDHELEVRDVNTDTTQTPMYPELDEVTANGEIDDEAESLADEDMPSSSIRQSPGASARRTKATAKTEE